jgi:hypothetical protein
MQLGLVLRNTISGPTHFQHCSALKSRRLTHKADNQDGYPDGHSLRPGRLLSLTLHRHPNDRGNLLMQDPNDANIVDHVLFVAACKCTASTSCTIEYNHTDYVLDSEPWCDFIVNLCLDLRA